MTEQRIDSRPPTVRPAGAVQRVGTATDRRPRRQEAEDRRKGGDGARKRRHLYDLLFDEIDQVPELEAGQRERLKRNIRAHLALRARDQTPLPAIPRPPPDEAATGGGQGGPSAPPQGAAPPTPPPPPPPPGGRRRRRRRRGNRRPIPPPLMPPPPIPPPPIPPPPMRVSPRRSRRRTRLIV